MLPQLRKLFARSSPSSSVSRQTPGRALRVEQLEDRLAPAVLISDQVDYPPGGTVLLTGTGFQPGESIVLQVLHPDSTHNTGPGHTPFVITDGGAGDLDGVVNGSFQTNYVLDPTDTASQTFQATAVGLSSGESGSVIFSNGKVVLGAYANITEQYRNGAINRNQGAYTEGNGVPQRYAYSNGTEGAIVTIDISYQYQKVTGSKVYNTFDFLTSDNVTVPMQDANRRFNSSALPSGWGLTPSNIFTDTIAIPDDPTITADDSFLGARNFLVYSNFENTQIVSVQFLGVDPSDSDHKVMRLVLQMGDDGDGNVGESIVDYGLYWGGHLARDIDYPGENTGAASAPGKSNSMDVSATQTAGGNIPNQSTNVDATVSTSLSWEKRDAEGSLLGGATFTISPNPFGTGSLTVVDNGIYDSNPNPGQITVQQFPFGTYTITEIVAPTGYLLDTVPTRVQTISQSNPNAVVGVMGQDDPGTTNESDFHNARIQPGLTIEKTPSVTSVSTAGQTITYTYTVTNTGNIDLTNVTVVDDQFTSDPSDDVIVIGPITLATGTSATGTLTYTVTQADIDAGAPLFNTATADSDETVPETDAAVVSIANNPALTIEKTPSVTVVSTAGQTITYTYTVTNIGSVTLTNVTVVDDRFTADPTDDVIVIGPITLDPGASATGTFTYTVTQADIDAGNPLVNTATADATETDPVIDGAAVDVLREPGLSIDKEFTGVVGGGVPDSAGDVLSYTITVTNTGNTSLTNVTVTDPLTGLTETIASLAPGDVQTFNATYTLTQDDLDGAGNAGPEGDLNNTATADSTETEPTGDEETVALVLNPSITLTKTFVGVTGGNGDGIANAVGDVLNYRFTVTNSGNLTLYSITLADLGVTISGGPITILAPGASDSTTFTATYTLTQLDIDNRFKLNTANVTGFTQLQEEVIDDYSVAVPLGTPGQIIVEKVVNPAGNPQVFSFSSGFGEFGLTGGQSFTRSNLAPGTYNVSELIPAGWNLATITITDPTGNSVVISDNTAQIVLDPGEVVTVRFTNFVIMDPPIISKVSLLGSQILAGTSGGLTQQVLFVNDLYNTLLTRVPSAGEVSGWVLQLQAGVSREQVTTGFLLSTEYLAPIVEQNYQQILNRSADAAGLAAWVFAMQQGLSESGLMAQLQASAEYAVAHPDNASFLLGLDTDDLESGVSGAEL